MGQAREIMDKLTRTVVETGDLTAIGQCYAENAEMMTPDQGKVTGRDAVVEWWRPFVESVSDRRWEPLHEHEIGDTAIDEGFFVGTNTGPVELPSGDKVPATNRQIRMRGCDIARVRGGKIVEHRFYFDQVEFLDQLGLLPQMG